MIKVALFMIMCSASANECMPPHQLALLNDHYDCMQRGYSESAKKIQEIGQEEINEHLIYIKFICKPTKITES
tara:strand:- start:558 stop:776 length:219 start_codon:yes stop_codon:yes gene_type:complete